MIEAVNRFGVKKALVILRVALRNLSRQRRRTVLLGGAIGVGIFVVTMLNGFTGSFIINVSENFSRLLAGHIFVEGAEKVSGGVEYRRIADETPLIEALSEIDEVPTSITRRTKLQGALIFQGVSVRQTIVGVDWENETYFQERLVLLQGESADMLMTDASGKRNGIIITKDIADKMKVEVGDRIIARVRTVFRQQNVGEFIVRGISFDPQLFGRMSAFANLSYVNELALLGPDEYQTLGIFIEDILDADEVAAQYNEALSTRVSVFERRDDDQGQNPVLALFAQADEETWEGVRYALYTINDVLSEVNQIVRLLNGASLVILMILFAIIMVGITNTFRRIMYERIKEIGTMRALGMQRSRVQQLFLLEALLLSLGGVLVGLILSGVTMFVLGRIYIGVDSAISILLRNGYFTFKVYFRQVAFNTIIVASLSLLAALLPSRKASHLHPVDALRAE